jgi:hypothetical protein
MVTGACRIDEIDFAELEMITAIRAPSAGIHVNLFGSYPVESFINSESIAGRTALVSAPSVVRRIFNVDDRPDK